MELLLLLLPGLVGVCLWAVAVRPRLSPLDERQTEPASAALFVVAMLTNLLLLPTLLGGDGEGQPLDRLLGAQALSNTAAVLVLLVLLRISGRAGPSALGLRAQQGAQPLLTALAAWLMLLPLLGLSQLVNLAVHQLLSVEYETQQYVRRFLEEDGASSPVAWLAMVAVIPVCEEVLMRGALYGGLRRLIAPTRAALLSAVLFGVLHDVSAWIPVTVLGVYLAWLYERSGSLLAPVLVHALQNAVTLLTASLVELPP